MNKYGFKLVLSFSIIILLSIKLFSQNYPWDRPLRIAWSNDGVNFSNSEIYQDSSGVPCVIRWKGDTLICAFQWFREPINSNSWDRVAVKFSYDNGLSWTQPNPIIVNGLPANYQRPFDPTLAVFGGDSIRIFYSSSDGKPMGSDSIINTYSATSIDGINYSFEANPRVDESTNRVIDPAVIYFKNIWHYLAPIGSPQQGAYHYISQNGFNFLPVPIIHSDNMHGWTGNYMVYDTNELRFYGSGQYIWYNSSPNGGVWNGFVNTNVQGGDPSVVKLANDNYLMVFVGNPYLTNVKNKVLHDTGLGIFPNPVANSIFIEWTFQNHELNYCIYNSLSSEVEKGISKNYSINVEKLLPGIYFLRLNAMNSLNETWNCRFIKN